VRSLEVLSGLESVFVCGFSCLVSSGGLVASSLGESTITTSVGSSVISGAFAKKLPKPDANTPICNASEATML
jgi:hypothetical protein